MKDIDAYIHTSKDKNDTNIIIGTIPYILGKLSDILHLEKNNNVLDKLMDKITNEEYHENDKQLDIKFYNQVKNILLKG